MSTAIPSLQRLTLCSLIRPKTIIKCTISKKIVTIKERQSFFEAEVIKPNVAAINKKHPVKSLLGTRSY